VPYFEFHYKGKKMEEVIIKVSIEIVIAILVPTIPVGIMLIRYFWKKEKCFTLMKQKIDDLSKAESGSHDTHGDFYEKFDEYGNRLTELETKMDLILDNFKIKYVK